jgi:hypothetical protein
VDNISWNIWAVAWPKDWKEEEQGQKALLFRRYGRKGGKI